MLLVAALASAIASAADRVAAKPEIHIEPVEIKVEAGATSEPVEVRVTWPAAAGPAPDSLPLELLLPRSIETLVEVEAEPRALSFDRRNVATASIRFDTDSATPRARYRILIAAGPRLLAKAVMVLDVDNVRGLPPGAAKEQEHEDVAAAPVTALAELAFAVPDNSAASFTLGPTKQTVYGGDVELTPDLVSIVPGAEGWDRRARLAWKSPHADAFQWQWQVSLQPFPASAATPPAALAAGPVHGTPAANAVGTFWIDFGGFEPLGEAPPTATESADVVAVVPGAAASSRVKPNDSGAHAGVPTAVPLPGTESPYPARGRRAAGSGGEALAVPGDLALPEFPLDLYIRLVPRSPDGQPGGPPSNTVILHYEPGDDPAAFAALDTAQKVAEQQHTLDAIESAAAKLYTMQVLDYQPVVFEDPNRWGCVEFVETPPPGLATFNPKGYKPGDELCGEPYKGKGNNFDIGDLDPIAIAEDLTDFVSTLYSDLKEGVLDIAMSALPCPESLEGACRAALTTAMDAALASAGIPPSLPDFEELKAAAKGELVELATQTALNELPGGVACKGIPYCEDELRKAIAQGIDDGIDTLLVKSKEPQCGVGVEEAHAHGREPLPCFNQLPGFKVRPAEGAVYEPFRVTVRVTRSAAPMPDGLEPAACRVAVNLTVQKAFQGANLGAAGNYQYLPPAQLSGEPYYAVGAALPPLGPNQSTTIALAFTDFKDFVIPGFDSLQHTYKPMQHWMHLYGNGTGTLEAKVTATAEVESPGLPSRKSAVACGPPAALGVALPPD